MRFYPSKDVAFYAENLNAWERQKDCPPSWKNHRNRPEIYWPIIETRIKKKQKPKSTAFKLPVLDKFGCPVKPIPKILPIDVLKKPPVEKWVKVIYYFRDIEGARMKRIRDKDLYFDFPKKIPKRADPSPREMSLSLRAYRAKMKAERDAERARRAAERLAYRMQFWPKC